MSKKKEWKVYARELGAIEIRNRIRAGNDIAILPMGSVELHGPQLPIGTDTIIAEEICKLAAAEMKATVFDTITYTWPGLTKFSTPTISMTMEQEYKYVHGVCSQLSRNGFKRIYVVQLHSPGITLSWLGWNFFMETGVPLVFFPLLVNPHNEKMEFVDRKIAWEASMLAAAAELSRWEPEIDLKPWKKKGKPLPAGAARARIKAAGGTMGALGTDDSQHGVFRHRIDKAEGLRLLKKLAHIIADTAPDMAEIRDKWKDKDLDTSWPSQ